MTAAVAAIRSQGRRVPVDAQPDQLGVHLCHGGDLVVDDLDADAGFPSQRLENLQAAAALRPATLVAGVGQSLQLGQHG